MASISAAPFGRREWVLRVSAQSRVVPLEDERESSEGSGGPSASGIDEKEEAFDPGMPPLFGLTEIRAAIPKSFCVRDPWRSMSYVVCDVVVVLGLAAVSVYINSWIVWPLYWVAQWTMFWGLFVLGHDCGHGSFSNDTKLNSVVGLYFIPPFLFLTTDGELATGLITRIMGMLRMMNRGTRCLRIYIGIWIL